MWKVTNISNDTLSFYAKDGKIIKYRLVNGEKVENLRIHELKAGESVITDTMPVESEKRFFITPYVEKEESEKKSKKIKGDGKDDFAQ